MGTVNAAARMRPHATVRGSDGGGGDGIE